MDESRAGDTRTLRVWFLGADGSTEREDIRISTPEGIACIMRDGLTRESTNGWLPSRGYQSYEYIPPHRILKIMWDVRVRSDEEEAA